jgi:small subunit ribosomal protein S6
MRDYKLVLILKSDLKKERRESLMKDIESWIGKIESPKTESIGDRKLAYPIKKQRTGEYSVMNFSADTIPTEMHNKMRMQEDVLRYLLVRE